MVETNGESTLRGLFPGHVFAAGDVRVADPQSLTLLCPALEVLRLGSVKPSVATSGFQPFLV